jgi:hypothetical protein
MVARPARFWNPFAMRPRDDTGDLAWSQGRISIRGHTTREFTNVTDPAIVRQRGSWLTIACCNLVVLAMVFGGVLSNLTPSNPLTWATAAALNVLLIISTVMRKWLRVTYRSQGDTEQTIYLLAIRPDGKVKPAADMVRLYSTLREAVLVRPATPDSADA